MAMLRKINSQAKTETNTGFGVNAADYGGRLLNKDGKANLEKRGMVFRKNQLVSTKKSRLRASLFETLNDSIEFYGV